MRHLLTLLLLVTMLPAAQGQEDMQAAVARLNGAAAYEQVAREYAGKCGDCSANLLYLLGFACYKTGDDKRSMELMYSAVAKDPEFAKPYAIIGTIQNNMGLYKEAVGTLRTAISLGADSGTCYAALGDAYYRARELDSAIDAYKTALLYKDAPDWAYLMPGQVYTNQGMRDKALEAYYTAKEKLRGRQDVYVRALYNIGLLEYQQGSYERATAAYTELLQIAPADYQACAKLVQTLYARKLYDQAKPYKQSLYDAAQKGALPDKLKDKFCFDQFKCGDKEVVANEYYQDNPGDVAYMKHVFYVQDSKGGIEYRIQTEYAPYSIATGGRKYMLSSNKNGVRTNYGIGFDDGFNYDDMKKTVTDIIEGKMESSASK